MIINFRNWCPVPSNAITKVLPQMRWSKNRDVSPATETAALMLYIALNFAATRRQNDEGKFLEAKCTYLDLAKMTGLSKKLISSGLDRLSSLDLIIPQGSQQKRTYRIKWPDSYTFFKLPCSAVVSDDKIMPFKAFTLRSRYELYALKIYLYLAAVRDNYEFYSQPAYETISERLNIPERYIKRSVSVLINTGLLQGVEKIYSKTTSGNEPNKYFLAGCSSLVTQQENGQSVSTAVAADIF